MSHCGAQTWICSCSRGELMRTSVLWINASSHGVLLYSDMKINAWSCVWESNQYYFICTSAEIKTRIPLNCKQQLTPVKHLLRITKFPVFCIIMTSTLNFRLQFNCILSVFLNKYKLVTWKEINWHCHCVPSLPPSPPLPQGDSSICTLPGSANPSLCSN